jgi:N-acetylneuraminic acid mutarotase
MKPSITTLGALILGLFSFTSFGQNGVWTNVAAISPRGFGGAATVNGKVYMVGGGNYSCNVYSTLQAYDAVANGWVTLANMPTPRYEFGAAELNGLLYAIGGNPGCGSAGQAKRDVEAYNPVSNTWSTKALLPTGSWGASVASANGKIYVFDGFANYVYCYDPASNTWSLKTPLPAPRAFAAVAVVNGIIYVIGGSGPQSSVYAYDPMADSWTVKASMPTARDTCAGAALNGIIYVAGGNSSTGVVATVEAYNPVTDTWSAVTPLPYRVYAASAAAANGKLYVMGGLDVGNGTIGSVEMFTPSSPGLTNIVVTPANPIIGVGTNQQFTATGNYADGSSHVLTNGSPNAIWSSSSPAVASINTNGLATGLTNGVTTITATSGNVSNNTTLTVVLPPAITTQPTNNTVSPNGSVTLNVSATGGNLSYQWQLNGTNIAGANANSLTITNVSSTNIGVYSVIVNNAAGSVTSSSVTLASVDIRMFAGVIVNGPLGSNYLIQATSNLLSGWTTLTNVALPTQPYIYIDYSSPTNSQQFYRAAPQ